MIIHLHAWGSLACFTRPEMKVERVSYPVITPSAARGLLEAILYKPQFRWQIRRILVRKPIRYLAFRRNEVKSRLSTGNPSPMSAEEDRTQRNTLALRDVDYVIEASMELTPLAGLPRAGQENDEDKGENSLIKYAAMFHRRAEKGQCFVQPSFGCREFAANFELADASAMDLEGQQNGIPNPDADLGLMLYDVFDLDVSATQKPGKIEKTQPSISFFPARLKNGIVDVPSWSEIRKTMRGAV
ncbi:MAG TPA: type I-C CRISPR-associated protein Cas5c [Candidatus Methylacidiphilales bacterium]|nr:type I-C CRISPR-associated protein Cas5c [Candidatus Methylacidiphilales bacterium]